MPNTLSHSPADILTQVLVGLGVASQIEDNTAWPVFAGGEPASPDNCITIYDTEGDYHGRTMVDGAIQEHHGFQIRVRARDHATGYSKITAIRESLSQSVRQTLVIVDTTVYQVWAVNKLRGIFSLGLEVPASKRRLFTFNGTTFITVTSLAALLDHEQNILTDQEGNYLLGG